MLLPDVNVLVEAFRPDMPRHGATRQWLQNQVNADGPFGISPQALSAVIRITTNRKIFPQPSPLDEALLFADALLAQPVCTVVHPGVAHWGIFADLCRKADARGNLVQDAWFAALAIEHGCEWITFDRDYARFPGLRWRTPF